MSNFADKKKFPLYALPDTLDRVEQFYRRDGCQSKSEFIEKAIIFYCGYLSADDCRDYYPEVIVSTMKASLECLENRMASLLFKNTVNLSMLLHVIAATHNINDENLTRLRGGCIEEVKRLRGNISLEEAVEVQRVQEVEE